jgi:hypothetical protein
MFDLGLVGGMGEERQPALPPIQNKPLSVLDLGQSKPPSVFDRRLVGGHGGGAAAGAPPHSE